MNLENKLVFPTIEFEVQAKEYVQDFIDEFCCNANGDKSNADDKKIRGLASLDEYLKNDDYAGWIKRLIECMDFRNANNSLIPAITYFYVRREDKKIVGMINIRMITNESDKTIIGNIEYSVKPSEQGKHYATNMLSEALEMCALLGVREVEAIFNTEDIAAIKVMKNCGAVLRGDSNTTYSNNRLEARFTIIL